MSNNIENHYLSLIMNHEDGKLKCFSKKMLKNWKFLAPKNCMVYTYSVSLEEIRKIVTNLHKH
jgi:hypothetical protein